MARREVQSPWLTLEETAAYMHKSRDKVRAWVKSGALVSHKDPESVNGTLIHSADADALIRSWPSAATAQAQSLRR